MKNVLIASVFGATISIIVSYVLDYFESDGGFLSVYLFQFADIQIFWSWPLFLIGTGLSWAILQMMK